MSTALLIVSKVLPMILLILAGHLLRSCKFLKQDTVADFKKLIMTFSIPAILFLTFSRTRFESRFLLVFPIIFLACAVMLLAGRLFRTATGERNPYLPTVFCSSETGMIGYPLFLAVFGSSELYRLAVRDVGQSIFTFVFLAGYIKRINGEAAGLKELAAGFAKTPIILAIITGIVFGLSGVMDVLDRFHLTASVFDTLKLLADLTVPLICLAIGYELRIELDRIARPLRVVLVRMSLQVGLAVLISMFVLDRLLHLDRLFHAALFTLFTLPVPFVIPIFMGKADPVDLQFVLNAVSISIPLTLIAFMTIIAIFGA